MQLQLDRRWIDKLARLPESGMGYQRVRVRLRAGRIIENALVFNATFLQVADDAPVFEPQDIADIEVTSEPGR